MEPEETPEGIVDGSFVRAEYYLEPPGKGASVAEWRVWQKADRQAAINAKRAHTKSQAYSEAPAQFQDRAMVKVGGVWKQGAAVSLTGSAEDGTLGIEPAVDADQDRTLAIAHFDHGGRGSQGSARASGAERRKAKRKARKARQ